MSKQNEFPSVDDLKNKFKFAKNGHIPFAKYKKYGKKSKEIYVKMFDEFSEEIKDIHKEGKGSIHYCESSYSYDTSLEVNDKEVGLIKRIQEVVKADILSILHNKDCKINTTNYNQSWSGTNNIEIDFQQKGKCVKRKHYSIHYE